MVAQALADARANRRRPNWAMLGGGVLGSIGGELLTEYFRTTLLKREIGWEIFSDVGKGPTSPLDAYVHVQLFANLSNIFRWATQPNILLMYLVPLMLVVALALAAILLVRHGVKAIGLAAYIFAEVTALLAFGLLSETRDLLQLVPFLSLAGMLATKRDWQHF